MLNKTEDVTDALTETMPFFGKVDVELSNGALVGKQFRFYLPGRVPHIDGCQTCPGCPTGWGQSPSYTENYIPMGTPITLEFYKCVSGQWLPIEIRKVLTSTNHFRLEHFDDGVHWRPLGDLTFTEQTPPACGNATACDIDGITGDISISINKKPEGFNGYYLCGRKNGRLMFASSAVPVENSKFIDPYLVTVCFNEQTRVWEWKINGDNLLNFNYIITKCPQNINYHKKISIPDYRSLVDLWPDCQAIITEMENQKIYPLPLSAVYVIDNIWMRHEEEHYKFFKVIAEEKIGQYFDKIPVNKTCADFNDQTIANNYFKGQIDAIIKDYWKDALDTDARKNGFDPNKKIQDLDLVFANENRNHDKVKGFIEEEILSARRYFNCSELK